MKKTFFKILTVIFIFTLFITTGCQNVNNSDNSSSNETFKETTVFNPNSTKVKLISVKSTSSRSAKDEEEVCEVEPLEKKEVELGSEHKYYFTDENGNKIADLDKSDSGEYLPVYLELNEPKDGKEYLFLNQYKNDAILEDFSRTNKDGSTYITYGLLLYEIVNPDDLDAYKYDDETYIRTYPSANYWIDSEGYASNKIGTKIKYDEAFRNNFEPLSNSWVAWGWSTKNSDYDMWFCHRVVSYVLSAKDGDSYEVKTIGNKTKVSFYNPTSSTISIYDKLNQEKFSAPANSISEADLYLNYTYHFMEGNEKVEFSLTKSGYNFVLRLEKPVSDKKYICLDQYKKPQFEENAYGRYGIKLYEVVSEADEDSYKYDDETYIRIYPSANLWIDDKTFVENKIGKEVTYSDNLFSGFTQTASWTAWGWSTYKDDKWFCHFIWSAYLDKE